MIQDNNFDSILKSLDLIDSKENLRKYIFSLKKDGYDLHTLACRLLFTTDNDEYRKVGAYILNKVIKTPTSMLEFAYCQFYGIGIAKNRKKAYLLVSYIKKRDDLNDIRLFASPYSTQVQVEDFINNRYFIKCQNEEVQVEKLDSDKKSRRNEQSILIVILHIVLPFMISIGMPFLALFYWNGTAESNIAWGSIIIFWIWNTYSSLYYFRNVNNIKRAPTLVDSINGFSYIDGEMPKLKDIIINNMGLSYWWLVALIMSVLVTMCMNTHAIYATAILGIPILVGVWIYGSYKVFCTTYDSFEVSRTRARLEAEGNKDWYDYGDVQPVAGFLFLGILGLLFSLGYILLMGYYLLF